jgi:uncharacterized protein with HEPN domain
MSRHNPRVTLRQIQEAGGRLQSLCAGETLVDLLDDWQATAALERFIEVLGEAVKRLPLELRARYPVVPWKEITGFVTDSGRSYARLGFLGFLFI